MKTKNNLTTGILIGISVVVLPLILMSSSTSSSNNGVVYGTPESHVWEMVLHQNVKGYFSINKVTGEVRVHDSRGSDGPKFRSLYTVSKEIESK